MSEDRPVGAASGWARATTVLMLVVAATSAAVGLLALLPGPWTLAEAIAGSMAPVVSLLGAAAGVLAVWWGRRRSRVVGTLVTLVAAFPLMLAAPGLVPRPQSGSPRLTVLSFNDLGGSGDAHRLAQVAAARDVDLVGLVECNPRCVRRMTPALAAAGYYPRAATKQEWGAGSYQGVALFARPRVSTGPVTIVETATGEVAYGAVRTDVTADGSRTRVVIIHLANALNGPRTWAEDNARLEEVLRGPAPLVVTGDLNTTSFHGRLLRTLRRTGAADCATRLGRTGRPTWGTIRHPDLLQIDHALVRGLGCASQSTVVVGGSDHRALITTVTAQ